MKKIISFITAFVMTFVFLNIPLVVSAEVQGVGWTFDTDTGTLIITTNEGTTAWNDSFPSTSDKNTVQSVVITNGVSSIGDWAFYYCQNLTSVNMPETLKTIGEYAFGYCELLERIDIPTGVTEIGSGAFSSCYSLDNITLPDGITKIEDYTFDWCKGLTSVHIPSSVQTIGKCAFDYCKALESIDIPYGVETIGVSAFGFCDKLSSVTIPDSVTEIGDSAFESCKALTSITIPGSVLIIDQCAFFLCSALESVTISEGVSIIGLNAFKKTSLKDVTLPSTITNVYYGAFANTPLIQITYPISANVNTLPDTAAKVKYSIDDDSLIIKEVDLAADGNLAVVHDEISGIPVAYVESNFRSRISEEGHTHKPDANTLCTAQTSCVICGKYIQGNNHDYVLTPDDTGLQHCIKCTHCGDIIADSYEDHLADGDFIADNPNYNYQKYHYQKCRCGMIIGNFHTSDNGTIKLEPTYESSGERVFSCTICGYVLRTETILPLSHEPDDEWISDKDSHWKEGCGCGEKHEYSEHISDSGTVTLYPTHTENGEIEYRCTVCGYVTGRDVLDMIPHTPEGDWQSNAQTHYKTCSCGEILEETPHTPDNGTVTLPPTYVSEGKMEYHCTVCGYLIGETAIAPLDHNVDDEWQSELSGHWQNCECGEKHNFGEHISDGGLVTTQPTYETWGERVFSCTICGYVLRTETILPLSHEPDDEWVSDKDSHWKEGCGCGEKHEYSEHISDSGTVTLYPTHTENGEIEYRCTVCGYVTGRDVLDMIPHTPEGDWQSNAQAHYKTCSCGEMLEVTPHIPDNGTVTLEPTYASEGKMEYHCTVCGYLIGEETIASLDHNIDDEWQSDVSGHWQDCECGEKHNFGEHISDGGTVLLYPTHTENGEIEYRCTVCGYIIKTELTDAIEHTPLDGWQSDSTGHWQECECGEILNFAEHTVKSRVTLMPTEGSSGILSYYCEICEFIIGTEVIPALGENTVSPSKPFEPIKTDIPDNPVTPEKPDTPAAPKDEIPFIKNDDDVEKPNNGGDKPNNGGDKPNNGGDKPDRNETTESELPKPDDNTAPPVESNEGDAEDYNPKTGKSGQPYRITLMGAMSAIIGSLLSRRKKTETK